MEVLRLEGVSKSFGNVHAVSELSMQIGAGTLFGLLGPNGAGKTTTIRMIMQIIMPDSGEIFLFGKPNSQALLDSVGYLPEERGLYRKMKIGETLQFFAELKGIGAGEAKRRTAYWLERFEMGDVSNTKVEELSKGNQQKIQLISTILHEPRLLILDEPFSGLDPVNTQLITDIMLELKKNGCCIIFSTHVMEQVEKLCDSICLINQGTSVLQGGLKEVKSRFAKNTVLMEFDGKNGFLKELEYVRDFEEYGSHIEIHLKDPDRAQDLIRTAVEKVKVTRFEVVEPSLHEIFIQTVKKA